MKNTWICIGRKLPKLGQKVEIYHEFFGTMIAKRSEFNVPTKNPYTSKDEFWFWNVYDCADIEVLLLNEVTHWRKLIKE